MVDGIYISTNCFLDRRPSSILDALEQLPGWGVEMSALDADENTGISFCRQLRETGRPVLLHNYFPIPDKPFVLNLAARDNEVRRRSVDVCSRSIDLSAEIGASHYAVHPGFAIDFQTDDLGNPTRQAKLAEKGGIASFDAFEARALESLLRLAEQGNSVGVTVLAENNVVSGNSGPQGFRMIPMATPNELASVARSGIPILFDVAHAKVSAISAGVSPSIWFNELRSSVAALHLSDNDGVEDTGDGFGDDAWFAPIVSSMGSVPVTLELNRKPVPEIRSHLERIAKWRS